jgi:hypothetical protein
LAESVQASIRAGAKILTTGEPETLIAMVTSLPKYASMISPRIGGLTALDAKSASIGDVLSVVRGAQDPAVQLISELGRIYSELDPGDLLVLNRRDTLRFCNSKGGRQRLLAGLATPMGRFEFLEMMEREQSGGDPTASLSYRDRPARDLLTSSAATIRARDELLSESAIIWDIIDRLRDALALFDDIEEPRIGVAEQIEQLGDEVRDALVLRLNELAGHDADPPPPPGENVNADAEEELERMNRVRVFLHIDAGSSLATRTIPTPIRREVRTMI